jgi:hypothetical protein
LTPAAAKQQPIKAPFLLACMSKGAETLIDDFFDEVEWVLGERGTGTG